MTVTYETIRQWCLTFGRDYARTLRRRRGQQGDTWHVDELFVTLHGRRQYLWRAVDEDGDVLESDGLTLNLTDLLDLERHCSRFPVSHRFLYDRQRGSLDSSAASGIIGGSHARR